MHITRTDRLGIEEPIPLSSGMTYLRYNQTPMRLRYFNHFPILGYSTIVIIAENGIAKCFDGVVGYHRVAGDDHADFTLAPALVEVFVGFCGDATVGDGGVVGVPGTEAFGHRGFEKAVFGGAAGEGVGDWLGEATGRCWLGGKAYVAVRSVGCSV